jgi:bifunctional non-homologous end joining protein LigD
MPDFWPLFLRSAKPVRLRVWAFDLLALNRKDLRKWSLRQGRLQALMSRFDCPVLLHSEAFDDGVAPLRVAEKHGLEGAVSKRRDQPYTSGQCRGWLKIKTTAWRDANRNRGKLFGET